MQTIRTEPLTASAFAPFGEVLEATGQPDRLINQGLCGRWHDRARLDFGTDTTPPGRPGLSLFLARSRVLPYTLTLLERHPEGAQAFIPMHQHPFLVITAPDERGKPGTPRAFLTNGAQGVNYRRGSWHGVLTPLAEPGLFAVIDRIGTSANLTEHRLDPPWRIEPG